MVFVLGYLLFDDGDINTYFSVPRFTLRNVIYCMIPKISFKSQINNRRTYHGLRYIIYLDLEPGTISHPS